MAADASDSVEILMQRYECTWKARMRALIDVESARNLAQAAQLAFDAMGITITQASPELKDFCDTTRKNASSAVESARSAYNATLERLGDAVEANRAACKALCFALRIDPIPVLDAQPRWASIAPLSPSGADRRLP